MMAELSERHPKLNLLDLEATAAGLTLDATLLLSVEATRIVLPDALEPERITWRVVELD